MTKFELIVQQLGKDPRPVPLDRTMTVGRSRRADLMIEDEEVGREQFRIGLDDGQPFIEGLGTTNQTIVDGSVLAAGTKRRLAAGTTIRVGRTTVMVRDAQSTTNAKPGEPMQDQTLVAERPSGPQSSTQTTDVPLRTMPGRPGMRPPTDVTPPPAAPKGPRPAAADEPEQTMQVRGGQRYRPGQAPPSNTDPLGPPPDGGTIQAMPRSPAPRPSQPPVDRPQPGPGPGSQPPLDRTVAAPGAAQKPPPPPPPRPAPPPAPVPAPAAAARPPAPEKQRPTTIAVKPPDLDAEIQNADPQSDKAVDVEARLHESLPRLFVKCDGMKRRVRLMKARNMLGRAESVDVLLPNESVSEQHAEITFDGKVWMLRDRGSTNGSFVDGGHLRGGSQELQRHSILGLGNVRAIFLCNDRRDPAGQRRLEERAAKLLVQAKRLEPEAAKEALRVAHADPSQSIAELLLMDTPLLPAEWATAITTARTQGSLLDTVKRLFEKFRKNRRAPKQPPQTR